MCRLRASDRPRGSNRGFRLCARFCILGRGIASEACVAAVDFLETEVALRSLYATVSAENHRSLRLLAQLGFAEVDAARYPHGKVVESDRVFCLAIRSVAGEPTGLHVRATPR